MILATLQFIALIGTLLTGLYGLVAPTKIEGFTGIKPVGERGIAEVRSIFGGTFIGLGLAPLFLDKGIAYPMLGIVYLAIGAVRAITLFLDKSREQSNLISLAVEFVFGVLLLL